MKRHKAVKYYLHHDQSKPLAIQQKYILGFKVKRQKQKKLSQVIFKKGNSKGHTSDRRREIWQLKSDLLGGTKNKKLLDLWVKLNELLLIR